MTNNDTILAFANTLAESAGAAILPYFRTKLDVNNKASHGFDPVTLADKAAETVMREMIEKYRPDDAIIGEEFGNRDGTSGWTWILDPIDGTRSFVAGASTWGVLIGAYFNNEPKIGIISQPFTQERYVSDGHVSKWHRNLQSKTIHAKNDATIANSVLATTDPFLFSRQELTAFNKIRKLAPITRYGLDCTAYGLLAHGGVGLVVENQLNIFDIAALIPIVESAGGYFTDWNGERNIKGGRVIAAANKQILDEAVALLKDVE